MGRLGSIAPTAKKLWGDRPHGVGAYVCNVCMCFVYCSPVHAVSFAAVTGSAGILLLAGTVNAVSASLALSNLLIYCAVYTPMKRLSTSNTAVGAVVGAIPPMIGWAAATGSLNIGQYVVLPTSYEQDRNFFGCQQASIGRIPLGELVGN